MSGHDHSHSHDHGQLAIVQKKVGEKEFNYEHPSLILNTPPKKLHHEKSWTQWKCQSIFYPQSSCTDFALVQSQAEKSARVILYVAYILSCFVIVARVDFKSFPECKNYKGYKAYHLIITWQYFNTRPLDILHEYHFWIRPTTAILPTRTFFGRRALGSAGQRPT